MNNIQIEKISDRLFFDNTEILKYELEYPQITNSNYTIGQRVFNLYNQNFINNFKKYILTDLYKSAIETYKYNKANGFPIMVYEIVLNCNITENYKNIVSLFSDQYIFTGGTHGDTTRIAQNWDLAVGRQFDLSNMFPQNPYYIIDILKEINKQIQEQIEKEGANIYFDDYCQLILDTFNLKNFYITSKYINVFFQHYDIAPYSTGIPTFKIDINKIRSRAEKNI